MATSGIVQSAAAQSSCESLASGVNPEYNNFAGAIRSRRPVHPARKYDGYYEPARFLPRGRIDQHQTG